MGAANQRKVNRRITRFTKKIAKNQFQSWSLPADRRHTHEEGRGEGQDLGRDFSGENLRGSGAPKVAAACVISASVGYVPETQLEHREDGAFLPLKGPWLPLGVRSRM